MATPHSPPRQKAKFTLLIRTRLISGFPFLLLVLGCWWLGLSPVIIASIFVGLVAQQPQSFPIMACETLPLGQPGLVEGSPGPAERGFPCDALIFLGGHPSPGLPPRPRAGLVEARILPPLLPPHAPPPPGPPRTAAAVSSCLQPLPSLLSFLPPRACLGLLFLFLCLLGAVDGSWGHWVASSGTLGLWQQGVA